MASGRVQPFRRAAQVHSAGYRLRHAKLFGAEAIDVAGPLDRGRQETIVAQENDGHHVCDGNPGNRKRRQVFPLQNKGDRWSSCLALDQIVRLGQGVPEFFRIRGASCGQSRSDLLQRRVAVQRPNVAETPVSESRMGLLKPFEPKRKKARAGASSRVCDVQVAVVSDGFEPVSVCRGQREPRRNKVDATRQERRCGSA